MDIIYSECCLLKKGYNMNDLFLDTQNDKNLGDKDFLEKQKRIVRDNSGFSPRTSINIDPRKNLEDPSADMMFSTAEIIDFAEGSDSD